ncbi:elongation factor Ts [Chloroflexota bacterium]
MKIPTDKIKELREESGAGVMECRNILIETEGDITKALEVLKERNLYQAEKKAERITAEGIIETYIHIGARIGAMVELNCETDFVARTDEFKELAHNLAMQITACSPQFVSEDDIKDASEVVPQTDCLLLQPYIKSPEMTVQDVINETIAKTRENIRVNRFARFELGN